MVINVINLIKSLNGNKCNSFDKIFGLYVQYTAEAGELNTVDVLQKETGENSSILYSHLTIIIRNRVR